jgi:predicted amidophosphoribosyltransferase
MIIECPGSKIFKQPQPDNIACPYCHDDVEIWTDEFEVKCPGCKRTVSRNDSQSCLDWCKEARRCVGDKVYDDYMRSKKNRRVGDVL